MTRPSPASRAQARSTRPVLGVGGRPAQVAPRQAQGKGNERASASPKQEDPRIGAGAKASGPIDGSCVSPPARLAPKHGNPRSDPSRVPSKNSSVVESSSGEYLPAPSSLPPDDAPLSHYKKPNLSKVGKDKFGKIIPHKRSEAIAKKIPVWMSGGYTLNDIALYLNVRPGHLKQHYHTELERGMVPVGMQVTEHIVKRVKKSDRMAIFFAKSRMGWKDGDSAGDPLPLLNINIHL